MVLLASPTLIERALREENDFLRERLRQLEEILRPSDRQESIHTYRMVFGVTNAEGALLDLLMRRERVVKEQYQVACCSDKSDGDGLLSVRICLLRKRLLPRGVIIATVWGNGYTLSESSKKIIRDAVAAWNVGGRSADALRYPFRHREKEAIPNV